MLVEQSVATNAEHMETVKESLKTYGWYNLYVEVTQNTFRFIVAGLDVMQEKEVMLSEANLEAFVSGHESIEGADKLIGTACTMLYLRYGISMDEWDLNNWQRPYFQV